MRTFCVVALVLLFELTASAATLQVEVNRQGFAGPIQIAVAPRLDGQPPQWSATKTLAAGKSLVSFEGLEEGLYVVMASGPQPLQRLSAKANLGSNGSTLRLAIPRSEIREGALTLTARAPSYLDSDAVTFELHGPSAQHSMDVELTRGEPRAVRLVDTRDAPIANATLITSCNGHVKSTAVTSAAGSAEVALPPGVSCAIYALPKEGSLAVATVKGASPLLIRVPDGSSSLRLALQSVAGEPFGGMSLLMRIDGVAVPPSIARLLDSRGFLLLTNEEGSLTLERIPPGTYDFWPYRTGAEGQMLYETATEFDAPISLTVLAGKNNATIKFAAR